MNKIIGVSFVLFISLFLVSCGAKKGTHISGNISDAPNMTIFLDKISVQGSTPVSKMNSDASGNFSFEFPEGMEAGIYRIRAGARTAHIIIKGNEKDVVVKGKMTEIASDIYEVEGSPETKIFLETMAKIRSKEYGAQDVIAVAKGSDALLGTLIALRGIGLRPEFLDLHKETSQKLTTDYPELDFGAEYAKVVNQLDIQNQRQMAMAKVKVGEPAPDIALEDPNGKVRKLSELKGNVVLLDFWASWCGPCRRENPKVVQTYHKYKDQGFTVYSVSLDGVDSRTAARYPDPNQLEKTLEASKNRWLAAIEKDKLEWEYHVSDLKKWDSSAAATYGVRSIPQTFLIGRDGKIAALNPRRNLEEELVKIL